jgi:UDP-N-acetylmuramoyl-L-alanyl-D-glutamate--2,6-diaminopimelate ligase
MRRNMKLKQLLNGAGINAVVTNDVEITGITTNSKNVKEGFLFIALPGIHYDGYQFITQAIEDGAVAVVSSKDFSSNKNVEKIIVDSPYSVSIKFAPVFYGFPSHKINLIGITGTNGKTTITYILESIFNEAGKSTGIIGTIKNKIKNKVYESENTTPQAVDLQKLLHDMVEVNVDTAIMEVSSHALSLDRVAGCEFDIGIFTNLTQDHLDFHGNMDSYLSAKKKLFDDLGKTNFKNTKKIAILNIDDPHFNAMIKDTKVPVISYGMNDLAKFKIQNISFDIKTCLSNFDIIIDGKEKINITTHLLGKHNAYNICAAFACAVSQNINIDIVKKGIEKILGVDGRFEFVKEGQEFACLIDYAHTDDALSRIIDSGRDLGFKRIITVFGCGGNRDRAKRPIMGEVAAKKSDYVIITSDNPREEDPARIALDVECGVKKTQNKNYEVIIDREQAIERALELAKKHDLVIIAGKGHENYQIIGNTKFHYSDKETVKKIIDKMKKDKIESFI